MHRLSLVVMSRGYSLVEGCGLLTASSRAHRLSLVVVACRLSSCGTWDLVASRHVRSSDSEARDRTQVSCTGRWILIHWTTRESRPHS